MFNRIITKTNNLILNIIKHYLVLKNEHCPSFTILFYYVRIELKIVLKQR